MGFDEKVYSQIVDLTEEGIWLIDDNAMIKFVNKKMTNLIGYSVDELLSQSIYKFMAPKSQKRASRLFQRSQSGRRERQQILFKHKNGKNIWVNLITNRIKDEAGNFYSNLVMVIDITAQKQIESLLRQNEHRLRQAQQMAKLGIWEWNLKTDKVIWSEEMFNIYKVSPVEFTGQGKDYINYTHPEDVASQQASIKEMIENPNLENKPREFRLICSDDSICYVRGHVAPTLDDDGEVIGMIGVMMDITETKRLEREFLRIQRMEGIGTLAGGIAHDLNNILSPILLSTNLLKTQLHSDTHKNYVEQIESSAKRASKLIQHLLTFARGVDGERKPLSPAELLEDMTSIIQQTFPKSIECHIEKPEQLWPVIGDYTQIHQVLLNLCVNARDAMPDGGKISLISKNVGSEEIKEELDLLEANDENYVSISVIDSGMGIESKDIERIFDPFYTTKLNAGGTGLGLSTAVGIIKSHRGFIKCTSEIGKGTNFTVWLPAEPEDNPIGENSEELESIANGEGQTILVIDDELPILSTAKNTLEHVGYEVLTSIDAPNAISLLVKHIDEINLIITDVAMPVMNGILLAKTLQKIKPSIKIIFWSGLLSSEEQEEINSLPHSYFIQKPFMVPDLIKLIQDIHNQS